MTTEENMEVLGTPNEEPKSKENKRQNEKKARPGLKLLLIAGMCVAFLIPQLLIQNLVSERKYRENDAESEVFQKWGSEQTIAGPFIEVDYSTSTSKTGADGAVAVEPANASANVRNSMMIMPELLDVKGQVNTKPLKRGIYDFIVYETSLDLRGQFKLPKDFEKNQKGKTCYFEEAKVTINMTSLRGLRDNVILDLGGKKYEMESRSGQSGLTCQVDLSALLSGDTIDFAVTIPFKGSGNLMFAPVGQTTTVDLSSDCATPSFNGNYLPDERQVNDSGFQANWKILAINRNFPQVTRNEREIDNSTFGVELKVPVEQYQQTDRAIKYAFLIILLTFAAVFFVEIRKATPIHPVQYLLIGIALIIFYTLLLSFSEHINFGLSYLIACVMTNGMIVVFMASIAKDRKTALGIGLLLTVLYAFVYVLLQLESYALLVGSVGLFIILGIAMFATQKIDWYKKKD